ncbi:MAG: hydroxyacid dehydrogenase [Planctomycetota bacterium]
MRTTPTCLISPDSVLADVFPPAVRSRAERAARGSVAHLTPEALVSGGAGLAEVEVLLCTWGMPRLDAAVLDRLPNLRLILYAAGSISSFATSELHARGVRISTATYANSIPVAEFTVSVIHLMLKRAFAQARGVRRARSFSPMPITGAYGSVVGLVSVGQIGRLVAERLRMSDLRVLAYDPFLAEAEAREVGLTLVDLPEIFDRSDVVSVHTPLLDETIGLIDEALLDRLSEGAGFINTARGAVVDEAGLIRVAGRRPDLQFALDVTHPEPPAPDSPVYRLENVFLTPHIAGSMGGERARLADHMVDELERYIRTEPLAYEVDLSALAHSAHRFTPQGHRA